MFISIITVSIVVTLKSDIGYLNQVQRMLHVHFCSLSRYICRDVV
jgi:gamma-glutamylcysteine synthetase